MPNTMQSTRFFAAAAASAPISNTPVTATLNDIYFDRESTRKINQLEAHMNATGEIVVTMPFIKSVENASVKVTQKTSFGELSNKIKAADSRIQSIFYFDVDGNCLSAAETIDKWSDFPLIMEVNSKYAYAINFNTNHLTSISKIDALTQEENILNICKTVGLNEHDQLVLANYIAKMHAGLKVSDPNAIPILEVYRILEQLNYAYTSNVGDKQKLKSFEELQRLLDDKLERLTHFMSIQRKIEKGAVRRSRVAGSVISLGILAQLAFIIEGTFVTHSWDIIEPISYQISLINMCASLGWYHMFLYNPEKQDVNSWVHTNYIAKKQRANGFSQDELDQLQEEIKVLETLVRKSVG